MDDFSSIQHSDEDVQKEKLFGHIKPNKKAKIDLQSVRGPVQDQINEEDDSDELNDEIDFMNK